MTLADTLGLTITGQDLIELLSELGAAFASVVLVLAALLVLLSLAEPRRKRGDSDPPG